MSQARARDVSTAAAHILSGAALAASGWRVKRSSAQSARDRREASMAPPSWPWPGHSDPAASCYALPVASVREAPDEAALRPKCAHEHAQNFHRPTEAR